MRFASTTSRTLTVLPPLAAHGINLRLHVRVAHGWLSRASPIRFRHHGVKSLGQLRGLLVEQCEELGGVAC